MSHQVRLDPVHAADVLRHLEPTVKKRIRAALRRLAEDSTGRSNDLDVRELDTSDRLPRAFRLRVGDWRVGFLLRDGAILVMRIFHRRDGYGWLERMDAERGEPQGHERNR